MKKIFTFCISILSLSAFGQENTFPTSGKVAIGTYSPKNILDLGSGTNNRGISWGGNVGNYANIWTRWSNGNLVLATGLFPNGTTPQFESSYGDAGMGKAVIELGAFENAGDIMFYGNPASAVSAGQVFSPTERMRIKSNGNVGIGTTSPMAKFDVRGDLFIDKDNGSLGINHHAGSYTVGNGIREIFRVGQSGLCTGGFFTISATRGNFVHTSQWVWSSNHNATGRGVLTQMSSGEYINVTAYLDVDNSGNAIISVDWGDSQTYHVSIQKMTGASIDMSNYNSNWTTVSPNYIRSKSVTTISNGFQTQNAVFNGNVGIGTTTPSYQLETTNNARFNGVIIGASDIRSSSNILTIGGGSELMRITSSNQLGIGTTSPTAFLDVNGGTRLRAMLEMPTNTDLTFNAYYSGGWKYRNTGYASDIFQDTYGNINFYQAASGAADAAISFNNRFTINNNGNVGIGTANPTTKLEVNGAISVSNNTSNSSIYAYNPNVTSNQTNYFKALDVAVYGNSIASGVTDNGYRIGLASQTFVYDNNFLGKINDQRAIWARHGAYVSGAGSTISNSYGVFIEKLSNPIQL